MVLEWTLGLKMLAYSSVSLHIVYLWSTSQGNMGDSEPPDILCESCACIIHRAACSFISETLTSRESLRDSKLPVTGYLSV